MKPEPKQVLTELLVLEAQGGSAAAFRDLHALWCADLRRLAQGRVGRPVAADEVAHDAWLDIARQLPRLEDPACFPRWAFRIVERRSADWVRREMQARRRMERVQAEGDLLTPASPGDVREADPRDEIRAVQRAVAALPAGQRELVKLYYELGRSTAEIAEIIAVPAGTVKSRLFAVRETLRHLIERKQP
ncbi:MAG: sigma-70 family RNA polymerase sigma factor [Candidatus Didemnitutus sp.]|nr:sigma-70 family RNA polymerase sigma factor [Candidatus Didemnitutus sp.]